MTKSCDFTPSTQYAIKNAIAMVLAGGCKRVDVNENTKVYMVQNVVRIDLRIQEV